MDNQTKVIVEQEQQEVVDTSWMTKVLAIGTALGAVTGLTAALLLVQRSKRLGEAPTLELGEGIKLGVLIFGLLRNVALLGERTEK
jgi:hypothetical protein